MTLFYKILAGIVLGLVIVRGGGMALFGLLKFAAPALLAYYAYQSVRRMVIPPGAPRGQMPRDGQDEPDTIEICPKCGTEKGRRHRCKK